MKMKLWLVPSIFILLGASCPPKNCIDPAPGPVCNGSDPSEFCDCWECSGRTDGQWKYTGDCPWKCELPMPECSSVNQTCSTPESPCWHNPTSNPEYCEEAPKCPEPDVCPYKIPEDATRQIRAKPYGQGQDSTPKICAGNEWCLEHSGKNQFCCPPAPEGSTYAKACNSIILKQACPSWEYKVQGSSVWKPCLAPQNPEMSCDHFDHDDPATSKYEGNNPECLLDGEPVHTGYFQIGHGIGEVRACTKDGVCSNGVLVNH